MTNITDNQLAGFAQFGTDLTPEVASTISGGATFILGNQTDIAVNYFINGQKKQIAPGKEVEFNLAQAPTVAFDKIIGAGYELDVVKLSEGQNNFDRNGKDLFLTTDLVANFL
jgi:hypothetical protein